MATVALIDDDATVLRWLIVGITIARKIERPKDVCVFVVLGRLIAV